MSGAYGGRVIGAFRLIERLGQGGMGTVWRARDEQLERDVAIKMILPTGDPRFASENAARLLIEAKAEAAIKSRYVAQVLHLGTTDEGELYIVMELLEGETLHDTMTHERLSVTRSVRIARHIAKGMQAAHALGIVHRDLKPANVMLVRTDEDEEDELVAKVLDFGIAKRTRSYDNSLTATGAVLGTLHFMAPEQIDGADVDARADIHALGAVLYRMLADRPAFDAVSLRELSNTIAVTPARSLVELGAPVPPSLDRVVLRCLEKKPEQRYASMADVDAALAACLDEIVRAEAPAPTMPFLDVDAAPVAPPWAPTRCAGGTLRFVNDAPLTPLPVPDGPTTRDVVPSLAPSKAASPAP